MLLTAAGIASLSLFFALHDYVLISLPVSISISLVWAWIFFSIERFLVLSIASGYSARHFSLALTPRLLVAAAFGLIISIPITLRIFAPDIDEYFKSVGASHVDSGLLAQSQALSRLAARSTTVAVAEWAVFLFFLLLEVSPIIAQLIVSQSATAYGKLAENRDSLLIDRVKLMRAESRLLAERESQTRIDIAEDMRQRELERSSRANEYVANALQEVLDRALDDWRQRAEAALAIGNHPERDAHVPAFDVRAIRAFAREGVELIEAVREGDLARVV
jgi:hypothetical protein